jgi:hypothetical protein
MVNPNTSQHYDLACVEKKCAVNCEVSNTSNTFDAKNDSDSCANTTHDILQVRRPTFCVITIFSSVGSVGSIGKTVNPWVQHFIARPPLSIGSVGIGDRVFISMHIHSTASALNRSFAPSPRGIARNLGIPARLLVLNARRSWALIGCSHRLLVVFANAINRLHDFGTNRFIDFARIPRRMQRSRRSMHVEGTAYAT